MGVRAGAPTGRVGFDWKIHAMFLAAAFAAGTVVGTTVFLPLRVTALQDQLAAQEERISKVAALESKAAGLEKANAGLKERLDETRADLFKSEEKNLFLKAPYPNGLERVKLGDSIDQVFLTYPESSITRSLYYARVDGQHPVFSRIFYYFYADRKIESIVFGLDRRKFGDLALKDIMVQTFGAPSVTTRNSTDRYAWNVGGKYTITMTGNNSYTVRLNAPQEKAPEKAPEKPPEKPPARSKAR